MEPRRATRRGRSRDWRLFEPILAGATGRDRALAAVGAGVGIAIVGLVGVALHGDGLDSPWVFVPVAASAVLLFAIPSSPMAQPWPVIGGNTLSALVGLCVAAALGGGALAGGVAVALAIGAMSLGRCLHPPGASAALTATLGGSAVDSVGWLFPLTPVASSAAILVTTCWAFHKLSGHVYPHVRQSAVGTADPLPSQRAGLRSEDVDAVLARMGETFDIGRDDLGLLLTELEHRVLTRERADLTCGEIMSRDVISVARDADPEVARRLLLDSGVRLLPVLDGDGRPVGGVGLRELSEPADAVGDAMSPPLTTTPSSPAAELVGPLTDGHRHAAVVVDADGRLVGLVAQADLLAALARPAGATAAADATP
jgi:CBS domain-containing membrane protein